MIAAPVGDLHYLWLIPEESGERRFENLVRSIAIRLGAIAFAPHVTLLGRLWGSSGALSVEAERLAKSLAPFDIYFTGVDHEDAFFTSLFLRIALDETLAAAHRLARATFRSNEPLAYYRPHLSILYGSYPATVKKTIREEIGPEALAPTAVDRLELVAGGERPKEWRAVATFRLEELRRDPQSRQDQGGAGPLPDRAG
jgi:hypothetical protein